MALGGIHHLWRLASASTGGASWWRVCYQRALPRLVFFNKVNCQVDADNSGTIDFEEFITMMASRTSDQNKIQKVFDVFDKNQDG